MTVRRRPILTVAASVALAGLAGCSTGDGTDITERATDPITTAEAPDDVPDEAPDELQDQAGADDSDLAAPPSLPAEPTGPPPDETAPEVTATAPPVSEVPETGVPGLDATDEFCAAWSRFGGSFQVIAVNAAFGAGDVAERTKVEVIAAPSVVAAHATMSDVWPDELVDEADTALDGSLGPLARRLTAGVDALRAAGATDAQIFEISDAWLAVLADRDPEMADVVVDLDDDLAAIVEAAVPIYLDEVGTWFDDDSLETEVATPLTDAYLAVECPDQGTLAGQEVPLDTADDG